MRALIGTTLYGTSIPDGNDGVALVTGAVAERPDAASARHGSTCSTTATTSRRTTAELWGNDYIAGGAGNDEICGELGNDVIQGDGHVDGLVDIAGRTRTTSSSSPASRARRPPARSRSSCRRPGRHADRRLALPASDATRDDVARRPPVDRARRPTATTTSRATAATTRSSAASARTTSSATTPTSTLRPRRPARHDRRPDVRPAVSGASSASRPTAASLTLAGEKLAGRRRRRATVTRRRARRRPARVTVGAVRRTGSR